MTIVHPSNYYCDYGQCSYLMNITRNFINTLYILCFVPRFEINCRNRTYLDLEIEISVGEARHHYRLAGIIYYGSNHFAARVINDSF